MKRPRSQHRILLTAFALAWLGAVSAKAATLIVTSTGDAGGACPGADCTLRQAIVTAAAGDTINFAPGITTITLTSGELLVNKNLTISGLGANLLTVQRSFAGGTLEFRIFDISSGSQVTISGLTIANGKTSGLSGGHGAGVLNSGVLTVSNCAVSGNSASSNSNGGGIDNGFGAVMTIRNCTISANTAPQGGGVASSGIITIINSTISGNTSAGGGGGLFNTEKMTITNSTIYGNTGRDGGGIFSTEAGPSTTLRNTIIAGNTGINSAPDAWGSFTSDGYNLVGAPGGHTGFSGPGDQVGTAAVPINPILSPLQDNGGPTKTHTLFSGSPAIDKGKTGNDAAGQPITTDQRGQPRPVDRAESNVGGGDGSDIGAVELGSPQTGPVFTVTTILERNEGGCTTDDCALVEALNVTNAVADANTINFTPGLTGAIGTAILTPSGLAITNPVTINGPGARMLGVTGRTSARVFSVTSPNVRISGLGMVNGKVSNGDGGIIQNSGGLTLTNCTLDNGFAAGSSNGGGIHNTLGASLTLDGCTVSGSKADALGGGIFNEGIVTATNCTFSANTAFQGGGIYSAFSNNASRVSLRNCTITKCNASDIGTGTGDGGGGVYAVGNNTQYFIGNSILARNTAIRNPDLRGNFLSDGHNFIGDVGFSSGFSNGVNGDQVGTSGNVIDPLLVNTLANNGGLTDTHALQSGSTAIGGGDDSLAPPADQRSYLRNGVSDIGAFELADFRRSHWRISRHACAC